MMVLRWMIFAALGVALCQAYHRRSTPKDFELAFKLLRGRRQPQRFLVNNDVLDDSYPNSIFPRNRKKTLSAAAAFSPPTRDCPAHLTSPRPSPSPSVYPIGELSFSLPTPTAAGLRRRRVRAECGLLRGLDDFRQLPPSAIAGRSDPGEVWLSWARLRASCSVATDLDGLQDNSGESEVHVSSLYMVVRQQQEDVKVEVAPSRDAKVSLKGLGSLSKDDQEAIQVELRSSILCIVNSGVWSSLTELVKEGMRNRQVSFMSKLKYFE